MVAIAQIGRQPSRRLVDGLVGPLAIRQVHRLVWLVLFGGIFEPIDIISMAMIFFLCGVIGLNSRLSTYIGMAGG